MWGGGGSVSRFSRKYSFFAKNWCRVFGGNIRLKSKNRSRFFAEVTVLKFKNPSRVFGGIIRFEVLKPMSSFWENIRFEVQKPLSSYSQKYPFFKSSETKKLVLGMASIVRVTLYSLNYWTVGNLI